MHSWRLTCRRVAVLALLLVVIFAPDPSPWRSEGAEWGFAEGSLSSSPLSAWNPDCAMPSALSAGDNVNPAVLLQPADFLSDARLLQSAASGAWAENKSYQTNCAEEDNVNVPLYGEVERFRITATHPTYAVGSYSCAPDFLECLPGTTTLLYPLGNAGRDNNPTYTWREAVLGTTEYHLYVQGSDGTVIFDGWIPYAGNCNGTICRFNPGVSLSSGNYSWWVQLRNPYGSSPWSARGDFAIGSNPALARVSLVEPLGNIEAKGLNYGNLTYQWTDIPGASWYRLYVQTAKGQMLIDQWVEDALYCDGALCSFNPAVPLARGAYVWWVLPWSQGAAGSWSRRGDFGCEKLWDDSTNVIEACYEQDWWRNRGMVVTVGGESRNGIHRLVLSRKVDGENSWPQYLVLYQDGNLRLIPHPPPGQPSVCFGSSVIVGPAVVPAQSDANSRPYVDIASVTVDPQTLPCFDVVYASGDHARLCPSVNRSQAVVEVEAAFSTANRPFAVFRSMWVADGNADVDHVQSHEGDFAILGNWTQLDGPSWFFHRVSWSRHNSSAPDIRIERLATVPTLISPLGNIGADTRPTYRWYAATGASAYEIYVQNVDGVAQVNETRLVGSVCGGGVCAVQPDVTLLNDDYRWWVRGIWGSTPGRWSARGDFTVSVPAPGAPTLAYPLGFIDGDTNPTYQWSGVEHATWYRVYVSGPGGYVHDVWVPSAASCAGGACTHIAGSILGSGAYRWWVRAWGPGGAGPWSARGEFFVGDPPPPAPNPQQPAGTLYQNTPAFQWSEAQYATHYRLYVEGAAGSVLNQLYIVGAQVTCTAGTCTVAPGIALADGAYAWWVQGSNATGRGLWSARADFTVDAVPDAPVPQQPVGTITDTSPAYTWSALPNATHYELYVTGLGGAYLLNQTYAAGAEVTCAGGTCQVTPADVLAAGDYRWWVRGVNNGVAGAWPTRTDFTVAP